MKKILVVGQKSSGKTTIGKLLAKELNLPFFDSDLELQTTFLEDNCRNLFLRLGEETFRKEERKILLGFLDFPKGVFSIGAGALDLPIETNFFLSFHVIFLEIKKDIFINKIQKESQYPYLNRLSEIFDQRAKIFQKVANFNCYINHNESPTTIVNQIKNHLSYGK